MPKTVAQRCRQETGTRRRPDESERREVERERARRRPLADDDVEPEVFERRIKDLLDRAVQPVDLIHEENVVLLEPGEDRGHVALALESGAGDAANADAELLADDVGKARLAETGWTHEEHVVERFVSPLRGIE